MEMEECSGHLADRKEMRVWGSRSSRQPCIDLLLTSRKLLLGRWKVPEAFCPVCHHDWFFYSQSEQPDAVWKEHVVI